MAQTTTIPLLKVKIIAPKEELFSGEALSLSSINSAGKFDILPMHANFVTLVENTPIIIRKTDKSEEKFNFPMAIIYASCNQVKIYTDVHLPLTPD
ncbi:MAG: hypothetical protein UU73_C0007G0027 [Candidatus Daviesbacteria bacterium GW2011_GWA1_41_61]|uniref:ATP synthase F1 complex delta/epsilon subunit N-terminal domain-containing protein n=1 Tax=Candidatus Daviesbacteria bacterium GW2011_GWA2_40_9 TaxID=1618424 RepID=A0A0G0TZP2_9BACT|nr:MAG: hypothetical protein UU26_C0014G0017 [Candidatus Daviesbacteria bacterium GW2011_GWC1_40_9]KKR82369.1 MAG: hypothetical protein UU29_C0014G0002 [Candidatus Daviesbacteria bacterium GW2011_GWA2_40_9]KKR92761.1 MAG: hypothetical protein UU44_C0005G0091 [Candidatus Daviesbacteria bacterium GW2011_GWB1_41_15]KKS14520.1 MAG: hypothetical protein UU73_C0007G0027 [Candidatus Daviesbacteria bacterium GW2011_GWA1_41_61]